MRYVNLKQIVRQTHEQELDTLDESAYEDRFKKFFDHDSEKLREVLVAIGFLPDLIKENGEYKIPAEDGELIQRIIEEYTTDNMKLVRKGQFGKVDM